MKKYYRSEKHAERVRVRACEMAATVLAGRTELLVPTAWSLAVFFESYITEGSGPTRKPFGPKRPAKIKRVI